MNQLRLRLNLRLALVLAGAALALAPRATGQTYVLVNAFPNLTFQDPVCMKVAPGTSQVYVAGREGQIWTFPNSPTAATKTVFLDISAQTQGYNDSGLLGFAFHPQFGQAGSPNRGYVYVYYSYTPGPIIGSENDPPNNSSTPTYDRLSRFTVPDGSSVADPTSELVLINQYDRDLWHNGGAMFFGSDGYLYLTNGDEGGSNDVYHQTQKINSGLFSGILRIDVNENPATSHPIRRQPQSGAPPPAGWPASYTANYYIPNDNPWQDPGGSVLEEFYAIGLRSPWTMTFDPVTGTGWLADVGQNLWEEIDLLQKGANYQWSYMEGDAPGPLPKPNPIVGTDTPPIFVYGHYNGDGCVLGGFVYRGSKFSALEGLYIFGDYDSNRIWSLTYNGPGTTPVRTQIAALPAYNNMLGFGGMTGIGEDQNNELYFLTLGPTGQIWTLANPGQILNLSARGNIAPGQSLTGGFAVSGTGTQPILARGIGPGLSAFGVTGTLPNPQIQLYNSSGAVLAENAGWSTSSNASALASTAASIDAFPLTQGSADSALLSSVAAPGTYTVQLTAPGGTSGNAMVEVYNASTNPAANSAQMVNFSCLAPVGPGANILTAGFVISGSSKQLLVRADGPALAAFDVPGSINPTPLLQIYDSSGNLVAQNSGWSANADAAQIGQIANAVQYTGAFPLVSGSADATLLLTLTPGSYTAQVSGVNSSGETLFEIYGYP